MEGLFPTFFYQPSSCLPCKVAPKFSPFKLRAASLPNGLELVEKLEALLSHALQSTTPVPIPATPTQQTEYRHCARPHAFAALLLITNAPTPQPQHPPAWAAQTAPTALPALNAAQPSECAQDLVGAAHGERAALLQVQVLDLRQCARSAGGPIVALPGAGLTAFRKELEPASSTSSYE